MEVLKRLLEISVYSIALFAAVMAVKKICKDKMSPMLHFAVWFIVIARLCIPMTIDSGLKLIVVPQQAPAETMQTEMPGPAEDNSFSVSPAVQDNPDISNTLRQQTPVSNFISHNTDNKTITQQKQTTTIEWTYILIAVWLIGILLRAVWMAATAANMNRVISRYGLTPAPRISSLVEKYRIELGIRKYVAAYILPNITTPALTIGLRPKMILPSDMAKMGKEQLTFAIKHELMHYKRKDNIVSALLRILEAVYWFNPVVWLLSRHMTADMETACDSMVVKSLDKQGRTRYVLTLLDMFSQKKAPGFMLSMALSNTEKIAEKRIRGVYMKNRSKRSVRIVTGMLVIILFMACFTTACQPTPEKAAVVGKAEGLPSQALNADVKEDPLPDVPEVWSDSIELNENCTLNIDAKVELPDTDVFPVFRLEREELDQEALNKLLAYFAPGANFYAPGVFTKEFYEQQLIEAKRGQFVDGKYIPPPPDDPWVKSIEEKLANAPVANEIKPVGTDLDYYSDPDGKVDKSRGKNFLYVNFTTADGKTGSVFAQRYDEGNSIDNRIALNTNINYMEQSELENQPDIPEDERYLYQEYELKASDATKELLKSGFFDNFTLTQDEAVAQADKVIVDLGIDSMGLVRAEKVLIERYSGMTGFSDVVAQDQGYVIEYTRKLDKIDGYISQSSSYQPEDGNSDTYAPPFTMEDIRIVISENGVEYFGWDGRAQKVETVSENSKLLPFEDIKERIVDQLKYENPAEKAGTDISMEIKIDSVRLESAYINVKDDINSVWDIPVWVAQGKMVYKYNNGKIEENEMGGIIISALDGCRVFDQDIRALTGGITDS